MAIRFGGVPRGPAHEVGNPILPRRDRAVEAGRSKVPPVPRAPRAKPRANSAGALARSLAKSTDSLRSSEQRQPGAGSPFSHARVSLLDRERQCPENQVMPMGPKQRASSVDRTDHLRGRGRLTEDHKQNQGMPWAIPKEEEDLPMRAPARRHTLRHEHLAADQALEWVPAMPSRPLSGESRSRSHARVNVYARELGGAPQALEISPAVQAAAAQTLAAAGTCHARVDVLKREQVKQDAYTEVPRGRLGSETDVPTYGRRGMLARENPVMLARCVAAH